MLTSRLIPLTLIFVLFVSLPIGLIGSIGGTAQTVDGPASVAVVYDESLYLPTIVGSGAGSAGGAIIIGHAQTDATKIPDYWVQQAKGLVVHYAHSSHGSQILSGLAWLEARDPRFNVDIVESGTVALPADATALRIYDGNNYPGNTYITPEMYWRTDDGKDHTRSVADTTWFDLSNWTWCGQMSAYNVAQTSGYFTEMAQLQSEYTDLDFIFYTGHTDGTAPGSTLWRNNDAVRDYVQQNDKILFDFADIESYDPGGTFYPNATDTCTWCEAWCTANPTNFECQSLPGCNHSEGLQCVLKGQAFWWMMARVAGWDGTPVP